MKLISKGWIKQCIKTNQTRKLVSGTDMRKFTILSLQRDNEMENMKQEVLKHEGQNGKAY